jgi:hypothetical protein
VTPIETQQGIVWVAVIKRLMMRDMEVVLATAHFEATDPTLALTAIGEFLYTRARVPAAASLFRMVAVDVQRFPDLAATIHRDTKLQLEDAVVNYLRGQRRAMNCPARALSLQHQAQQIVLAADPQPEIRALSIG